MRLIFFLILVVLVKPSFAQTESAKQLAASIASSSIKLDGKPDEPEWATAAVAENFIVNSPNNGAAAAAPTRVKILYNDNAIYISAYLYDNPAKVLRQLTARDGNDMQNVDFFGVFFDTYNDLQNGYMLGVTSRNVQTDGKIIPNKDGAFGAPVDKTWDAVWESAVAMQPDGWSVEMRIPFFSLRFNNQPTQIWGINFTRTIRRLGETSYWSRVNPNVSGFANQFGKLTGLANLVPPLRLSLLPYITAGVRNVPGSKGSKTSFLRNGGMDVKWGINESFTLDMTLVPDFGQVVSDDAVNNLTPYEVKFTENRPFFTEGIELFNKAGLFYSRRIGAMPQGYYTAQAMGSTDSTTIIKNPGVVQLYNATKFSGRTKGNLGIGVFNAVAAPAFALIENINTGQRQELNTSPLTNYNIVVLDQAFKNRSSLTFTNASTIRSGAARDANVSSLLLNIFDKRNVYGLSAMVDYSTIKAVSSYNGFHSNLSLGKVSGAWQYNMKNNIESDRYDPNDLGYLAAPNEVTTSAEINYSRRTPSPKFNSYRYGVLLTHNMLYKPNVYTGVVIKPSAFWYFKNFWDLTVFSELMPDKKDYFELRTPGRFFSLPFIGVVGLYGSSDSRKKWFFKFSLTGAESAVVKNDPFFEVQPGLRYRFNDNFSAELAYRFSNDFGQIGYAFEQEVNGDPIVALRQSKTSSTVLSGIYNFNSRMNLTFRGRHYWNNLRYLNFYTVDKEGQWYQNPRPFIDGKNANFNTWNFDMFYTWDFRYGSRLIIGYKNWLANDFFVDGVQNKTYIKNATQVFSLPHGNEITARLIWFIDYNQLRRKKNA